MANTMEKQLTDRIIIEERMINIPFDEEGLIELIADVIVDRILKEEESKNKTCNE